jgi:hypothetical protein
MVLRRKTRYGPTEAAFSIFAFGWGLDQFATILAHGWYATDFLVVLSLKY